MEIYKNDSLEIIYNNEALYLSTIWTGITSLDVFTSGLDQIAKALDKFKPQGLLIDGRTHQGIGPKGQQYAAEVLTNYIKSNNTQIKQAILLPPDIFSKVSVQGYERRLGGVETKYFKDFSMALDWLEN